MCDVGYIVNDECRYGGFQYPIVRRHRNDPSRIGITYDI